MPKVRQSASTCSTGHITQAGSRNARWARSSSPLAATYLRIRRRKGHQRAVTALARKLVVVVWHLLTTQQPYRYAAPERTRSKLRRLQKDERTHAARAPRTLDEVYAEAGLPLTPPATGEKRAAKRSPRCAHPHSKRDQLSTRAENSAMQTRRRGP